MDRVTFGTFAWFPLLILFYQILHIRLSSEASKMVPLVADSQIGLISPTPQHEIIYIGVSLNDSVGKSSEDKNCL